MCEEEAELDARLRALSQREHDGVDRCQPRRGVRWRRRALASVRQRAVLGPRRCDSNGTGVHRGRAAPQIWRRRILVRTSCVLLIAVVAVRRPALARDAHDFRGGPGQVGLDLPVGLPAGELPPGDAVWLRAARGGLGRRRVRPAVCAAVARRRDPAAGLPALREGERVLAVLGAAEVVHVAAVRRARRAARAVGAAGGELQRPPARGARAGAAGRARSRRTPRWRTCAWAASRARRSRPTAALPYATALPAACRATCAPCAHHPAG